MVLARWVFRATRDRVGAIVLSRWLVVLFVLIQVDAMVDWSATHRIIGEQPPWLVGTTVGALLLAMASQERKAVADLLYEERHALLWRQPLPARHWSVAIAMPLIAVGSPLIALAVIAYGPTAVGAIALFLGLWCLPAVLIARGSWVLGVGVTALAAGVATVAHALPMVQIPLAAAVWLGLAATLGPAYIAAASRPVKVPKPRSWRPRSPIGALLHRDLLCLWRTERSLVLSCLVVAAPIAAVTWGLRVNGHIGPAGLATATIVGLGFAAPVMMGALARLPIRLGSQLNPPSWPISALTRFRSWALLAGLLLAPSWAAAATMGKPIDPEHVRVGVFLLPICAGAALFLARRRGQVNVGAFLWWIFLCMPAGLLDLRLGLPFALVLSALATGLATRAIRHRRGHP